MFTKEDYVSLETAKMLKDKGFDEPCERFYCEMYDSIQDTFSLRFRNVSYKELEGVDILIPTLYEAQKWLTQIHSLYVNTICYKKHEWDWIILSVHEGRFASTYKMPTSDALYETFQQALDAGIREALKMI